MKKVAILLITVTILSKILGLFRDIALSYYYGASSISDVYIVAITISTVIYSFIIKGISTSYIPMYKNIENLSGKKESLKFTNNLLNITIVFSLILIVISFLCAPQLVKVFAYGFNQTETDLAILFTRISLMSILFTGMVFLFSGYLNVENSFVIPTLIGLPLNIVIILSIYLSSKYNIEILIYGSTFAIATQLLLLIPYAIKKGYKYSFTLDFKDEQIKKLFLIAAPVMIGVSINQINVLVDRTIASQIITGGISALNYANKINLLVQGIFVVTISTVMYPLISKMAAERNYESLKIVTKNSLNSINLFVIPSTVGSMIFSKPIIEVLFLRGEFDQEAYLLTASALFFYSIGMIGFGLREVLSRVFYSLQDSKTPMINAAIGLVLNLILNLILSKYLGIAGLALATSISAIFTTVLLFFSLKRKISDFYIIEVVINFGKILIASIIMGFLGFIIYEYLSLDNSVFFSLTISIISCSLIYLVLIKVFKINGLEFLI